jgi:hypothetical protein
MSKYNVDELVNLLSDLQSVEAIEKNIGSKKWEASLSLCDGNDCDTVNLSKAMAKDVVAAVKKDLKQRIDEEFKNIQL